MPEGRQKYLHGVGAVCKFTLDIQDSPYTGLFKNGVQTGIIRIGSALDMADGAGLMPGAGIKFLRTGKTSGNIMTMVDPSIVQSLSYGESYNIFDPDLYPLYNHNLEPFKAYVNKMLQASECTTKVGLSDIAR